MGAVPMTSVRPFLSLRYFVEQHYGAGAFARIRRELAERHRLELDLVLRPGGWYPTEAFVRGLDIGKELFGPDDFCERFGEAAADYEIHLFSRIFLRFTSPAWMVEHSNDLWSRSHDSGRWTCDRERPTHIKGTLHDFALPHEGHCRSLVGWFRRACAMTGVRDVTIEHPFCRARGLSACVWDGRWR
jgi:hypothetical protein